MKRIIYLILLTTFIGCKPHDDISENNKYSQEIEDKITRIIENLQVETQFWNHYKTSTLKDRMSYFNTPGISIAVINNGKLEWARGFGYKNIEKKEIVTQNTLFQAASISKPVAALAFMKLKENNEIDIDTNISKYLQSWQIPSNNGWTPNISIRQLLSHTAGFTVHGFPGYAQTDDIPTTGQILNGAYPCNTEPVIVNILPGTRLRYSGGGVTIAQLILEDKFNEPFYKIMDSLVLIPLKLENSTYQQPVPKVTNKLLATGYLSDYQPINGGNHIYPEMAAAGLWTSPSELSIIVTEIQKAIEDKSDFISSEAITEMLTPQKIAGEVGIGFFLSGEGDSKMFQHNGGNYGFNSRLVGYLHQGKGAIVMINANTFEIINEVMRSIAIEYDWPDYFKENKGYALNDKSLESYTGRYVSEENWEIIIAKQNDKLTLEMPPQTAVQLIPESENKFYSEQLNIKVEFIKTNNKVERLEISQDWWKKIVAKRTDNE
jgi:CubicO group peptidase (beta-lactamase class C family)